jgi:peptidoglycan/xylan/chitin deacetylase (PgdA/CDA1 family)
MNWYAVAPLRRQSNGGLLNGSTSPCLARFEIMRCISNQHLLLLSRLTTVGLLALFLTAGTACDSSDTPSSKQTAGKGRSHATTGGNSSSGGGVAGGGAAGNASAAGGIGETAAGGTFPVGPFECELPAVGAGDVPKPSGTAGNLRILDWAGYKGAVTYTFDDANSSQISNYAALQALGVRMTFYLTTGKADAKNAIWAQALADGHELGSHTKGHLQTGTAEEIDAATTFIEDTYGVRPWTFAAPYGAASFIPLAQTRFMVNRGVNYGLVLPNDKSNPFNLPCYAPPQNGTASVLNAEVDSALAGGGWRIMLVHGFIGGTDYAYQPIALEEFTSSVTHAKSLGTMWLDSMVNVGAYWIGQKTVAQAPPTTSGNDTVWTWALPPNFPPGKCLRVVVDGGTLTQGDTTLGWNPDGYYEVSLDKAILTLSP